MNISAGDSSHRIEEDDSRNEDERLVSEKNGPGAAFEEFGD